jgi:predicted nucleic acid-binding Zn ribbon protein
MPTYRFRCRKCGAIIEDEHAFDEPHLTEHILDFEDGVIEVCGKLERLFGVPHVVYKGSGFYATDKWRYEPEDEDE